MVEQAQPTAQLERGWLSRTAAWIKTHPREVTGYLVWGAMGVVVGVPEIWAAADNHAPWPTISGTIGHLEYGHNWVAIIVIALIVWAAYHALRPPTQTDTGRRTRPGTHVKELPEWSVALYFAIAVAAVAGGSAIAASAAAHRYVLAYVLYGLIAVFWIVIPNALAYAAQKDIPFPTLFNTLSDIESRARVVAVVVGTGLVILLVHLTFYPWPAVIPDLQDLHKKQQQQKPLIQQQKPPSPYAP
jgi:hypothetical protein